MTAWLFILRHRDTRSAAGLGLVAIDAHYASTPLLGAERIERTFASAGQWKDLARELSIGLPSTPLSSVHVVPTVLVGDKGRDLV